MSISHAKAHLQRHAAAQSAETPSAGAVVGNQYELMLAKLAQDKRRLHDIQSIERKAEVKRQLLPEYLPWIEGAIAGDTGQQDDVLMTVFVWTIDIGDFETALKIGRYAIEHDLVMPDQYQRNVATVLTEEIADQSLKAIDAEQTADRASLLYVADLTADKDMPDQVRAKLHKAIGYAQRAAGYPAAAKESLTRALELHDKCGVKKDIERLETLIKNSPEAQSNPAPPAPGENSNG